MNCKKCRKEIDEDSKFCKYCGIKLTENTNNKNQLDNCHECGYVIIGNSKFCSECGSNINKKKI